MNGILVLDKPEGITSMTAVSIVRHRLRGGRRSDQPGSRHGSQRAKVGHAGTLDPLATGVLVVAIGQATRAIDVLMATDKRYRTEVDLTAFTATDDRESERSEINVDRPPTREAVLAALTGFTGEFMQRPPAFSAIKIEGRRAYKRARGGETPTIQPRPVTVHELVLVRYDWPVVELDLRCAKGFYVRSLARDLGEALGTGGHCASIRRVAVGPFTIEMARPLDSLPERLTEYDLVPLDRALEMVRADSRV